MGKEVEKELLSSDEFDKLVETGGIDAGKKYLVSIIERLPSDKLHDLFWNMVNGAQDGIISAAKAIESIDEPSDEQIADISMFLSIKMEGVKGASAEDTLKEILTSEGITLHHNTFQRIVDEYNKKG